MTTLDQATIAQLEAALEQVEVTQADRDFAQAILDDLTDRKGFRQAYDNFDGYIQREVLDDLAIHAARHRTTATAATDALLREACEALERIAQTDLLEIQGYHTRKWYIPETGSEYESKDPVFKRSAFQNAQDFQEIARATLSRIREQIGE